MSALSNYSEDELLDHFLGEGARDFTSPAALYMALHSGDPGETGASELVPATETGYARQAVTFSAASSGTASNSGTATFGPNTKGSDWAAATHFGIWDASTSGNYLVGGALTASKTIGNGDSGTVASAAISVSLA